MKFNLSSVVAFGLFAFTPCGAFAADCRVIGKTLMEQDRIALSAQIALLTRSEKQIQMDRDADDVYRELSIGMLVSLQSTTSLLDAYQRLFPECF